MIGDGLRKNVLHFSPGFDSWQRYVHERTERDTGRMQNHSVNIQENNLLTEGPSQPAVPHLRFGTQVFSAVFTNFAIGLVGLLTGVLLARLLGAHGRGELAAIQTWPTCLAAVATLGLPEALVFLQARDSANARRYIASALLLIVSVSPIVATVGYFLMPHFLANETAHVIRSARHYMLFVPFYSLFAISLSAFRSSRHLAFWNVLRIAPGAGWLLLILLALVLEKRDAEFLAIGNLAVIAGLFLLMVSFSIKLLAGSLWPSSNAIGRMLTFGLPTLGSTLPQVLNCRLDQLFLTALIPPHWLGLYIVAVAWGSMANPILSGLSMVLFPHLAALANSADQRRALLAAVRIGLILSLTVAVALAAAAPWILPLLFGRQFAPIVPTAMVLSVATSLTGFNLILEEGLRGLGKPRLVMWAELTGAALTGLSLLVMLNPLWVLGAALALLAGSAAVAVILIRAVSRWTEYSYRELMRPSSKEFALIWHQLRQLGRAIASVAAGYRARLI